MDEEKEALLKIAGEGNVSDDPETIEVYSGDHSFTPQRRPRLVVRPKSADEVQQLVRWANQTGMPIVPVSSGPPHFRGDTVPSTGGAAIVDLSGMKRIIRIDRRNKMAIVEPGVTFGELQPALSEEGLKLPMPLLPRNNKSVLTSFLEREPTLVPRYQWQLGDPLRNTEIIWGSGDMLRTGEAGIWGQLERQWELGRAQLMPFGPGQIDYYRLVQAAQGSMGIVTWASIRCELSPQLHRLFFVTGKRLEDLLDFAYRLLWLRYGDELLLLNYSNFASILGQGADEIRLLKNELPQWVLILGIAGRDRRPKERVEYQQKDISEIAQQFGVSLATVVPGARDTAVLEALLSPSKEPYWKLRYKGGFQDIFFLTTLDKTPGFLNTMCSLSQANGISPSDIGVYIQPLMQGVACHCEFSLPFDPNNPGEAASVKRLLVDGSEELMKQGAFFSRPYGIWADMAYNRDAQTTILLKKLKGIFDPKNVMNPGKLCF